MIAGSGSDIFLNLEGHPNDNQNDMLCNSKNSITEIELNLINFKKNFNKTMRSYPNSNVILLNVNNRQSISTLSIFHKNIKDKIQIWNNSIAEINAEIDEDLDYSQELAKIKKLKEFNKNNQQVKEIEITLGKASNYSENNLLSNKFRLDKPLNGQEVKSILKVVKQKNIIRKKERYVNEEDFSFSDDSIDYSIFHDKIEGGFIETLTEILKKTKNKNDLDREIKNKKIPKLKLKLEKDFKTIIARLKELNLKEP